MRASRAASSSSSRARRRAFLAPLDVRKLPGVGPEGGGAAARCRHRARSASSRRSRTATCGGSCPGSVGAVLRDRARGIDPRGLEHGTERISISVENTFERDLVERELLHHELRGMAREVAEHLQKRGQVARTVTTKLRYADFSIRSRSTLARRRDRRRRADRRSRVPPARPRPARPARARCASSASASPGSWRSGSSRSAAI